MRMDIVLKDISRRDIFLEGEEEEKKKERRSGKTFNDCLNLFVFGYVNSSFHFWFWIVRWPFFCS